MTKPVSGYIDVPSTAVADLRVVESTLCMAGHTTKEIESGQDPVISHLNTDTPHFVPHQLVPSMAAVGDSSIRTQSDTYHNPHGPCQTNAVASPVLSVSYNMAPRNDSYLEQVQVDEEMESEHEETDEVWTMEERYQLFQLVTKVFLMKFPSYVAYKHVVHSSLEELSQQETRALYNYSEISDSEVPLYQQRNVCFFCDSNGVQALQQCFEKPTPDTLPFTVVHTLINIIANLCLRMNISTVMQCIVPLRTAVILYMCQLSDKDLRMAGTRNMTAVKEPLDTHFTYDKEGLDLAFKYFTCSTLTIRLAGIAQINRQIDLYNEFCNNDTLVDAENVGNLLGKWLLENKIIEHIFGPDLHVEIIKQSQIILNILAVEGKITNEHIDCIWAASQLKHCSKQVYDILIPRIKNLDLLLVQHLSKLVSSLARSAHTVNTLLSVCPPQVYLEYMCYIPESRSCRPSPTTF